MPIRLSLTFQCQTKDDRPANADNCISFGVESQTGVYFWCVSNTLWLFYLDSSTNKIVQIMGVGRAAMRLMTPRFGLGNSGALGDKLLAGIKQ